MLKQAYGNAARFSNGPGPDLTALLNQGLELHRRGQLGEAATVYGKVLEQDPDHFDALHLLGVAAHQSGNHIEALQLLDRALQIRSDLPEIYSNRSSALMSLGRFDEAYDSCQKAIEVDPSYGDGWFNAGNALSKLGRRAEAIRHFQRAVQTRPNLVAAWSNLAGELLDDGRYQEAKTALKHALKLDPNHVRAHLNMGVVHMETGNTAEAEREFAKSIELEPQYTRARLNMANLAFQAGRVTECLQQLSAVLEVEPCSAEVANALANCHKVMGQPVDACEMYRQATQADRSSWGYHSNLLLAMLGEPRTTAQDSLNEALRYAARHAPPCHGPKKRTGPLKRIGFVSPDFRIHPVGFFLEPLLRNLSGVEVVLYANQNQHDRQTAVLASLASGMRTVKALSTDQVCEAVREDEIDVLVDLAGHTADSRLDVFAKRAAAVQVTWLGYSSTTGLSQFDALIGDPIVTPPTDDPFYSEPVFRLPHSFVPMFTVADAPDTSPPPSAQSGYTTFGSFNATSKIHDGVIEVWSRILHEVPGSRLVIKNLAMVDPMVRERFAQAFLARGIESSRLTFSSQTSRDQHFADFSSIDVALDTFPYSGATTTLDNLWMGVPVVTLRGDHYAGRMSASLVTNAGFGDLVAETPDLYVQNAVSLANDGARLEAIRRSLRNDIALSPLGLTSDFANAFLSILSRIWEESESSAA